ncbi:hypothetical protein CLOSTHATH_02114 [Hungatella hathewayi DSM 13479]|uniref:Uncharacterized protein n=1 Tax=Hungatella hathewayi DSM 13479 TaxID=566550 RepID=D3AET0_9FIRM|nr:hypothetical protein CLOSTHATH_02114 [Hungatella hathewayi DSM 13479]
MVIKNLLLYFVSIFCIKKNRRPESCFQLPVFYDFLLNDFFTNQFLPLMN